MALSPNVKEALFNSTMKVRDRLLELNITPEEIYDDFITPCPQIDNRFDDAESHMQEIRENREESLQTIALAMGLV